MIIAIDGTGASGKGTIAKLIAEKYKFYHFDTGLLYRFVAMKCLNLAINLEDDIKVAKVATNIKEKDFFNCNKKDLISEQIGKAASIIARKLPLRQELLIMQRAIVKSASLQYQGVVVDGRDIGTVVFPNANKKIFITASLSIRASRRLKQLQASGFNGIHEDVVYDLKTRDQRDANRDVAPMRIAEDAFFLDTTDIDVDVALEKVIEIIDEAVS